MRFARPMRLIPAFLATLLIGVLAPTVTASAAVPVCADLQIGALSVSPATPIAGQQATITVPVYNAGTCTAFGATVQWKKTPYAASGPSKQINSIDAGQTVNVLLKYTFPKAGNFESTAKVDTKNVVSETNEKNNTQLLPITVLAAGVDLSISSISTTPDAPVADGYPNNPVQGRNETTTIVVHNNGNTASGPFQVKWVPKPFTAALTKQISGLAANSSTTVTLSYTYQRAGNFKSTATVDATRLVKETNERNNKATLRVHVDPQRADLIVTDVAITPTPIIPGGLTTATITVKNQGNTTSNAFMVNWRPQPFTSPVSRQVGPLAPNASAQVQLQFTFARAGSFAGLVMADSTRVVKEINEWNNTLATHVVVEPNTVDLQIVGETITGFQQEAEHAPNFSGGDVIGTPTQGEPVRVDIQVKNTGNTNSGPFLVDWNPDALYVSSPSLQTVTQEVADLGAGQTTTVTFFFTYDVYGNFETLTTLDPRNSVTETNEANNQNILPITVVPAPIDLTGTMDVNPKPAVRGVQVTNTVTVTNHGNFPASKPFTVQWFPTGSGIPQTKVVNGLSPGDTTTLTFTGTYLVVPQGGTYDSKVVIDSGNAIPETNEGNNTITQTVTVVPQSADVTVSLDHLHALNNMEFSSCVPVVGNPYDCGSGEWGVVFLVFDPTSSCDVNVELGDSGDDFELKLPSVYCGYNNNNHDVDDDSNLTDHFPMSHTVHLVEQTPLVAGVGAVEEDFAVPDIPGFSTFIKSRSDYLSQSGLVSTPGQSCARVSGFPDLGDVTPVDDGHCFDAYWGVSATNVVGASNSVMMHSTLKTNALNAAEDTIDPGDGSYTQDQAVAQINSAYDQIQAAAVAAAQAAGSNSQVHVSMHSSTVK